MIKKNLYLKYNNYFKILILINKVIKFQILLQIIKIHQIFFNIS